MHVLIVKTSSLGDVIHTLPALTDACAHVPNITFDWVVEPAFQEIPTWHPAVEQVIPFPLRQWRHEGLLKAIRQGAFKQFRKQLRAKSYDLVIDAQGLWKSALVTRMARAKTRCGYSWSSAREPWASLFYQKRFSVEREQHAIARTRALFAQSLGYDLSKTPVRYALQTNTAQANDAKPYWVFLHGTTWSTKEWPAKHWHALAELFAKTGMAVHIPWGNDAEHARAQTIAQDLKDISVLPKLNLNQVGDQLKQAAGVVALDTGLAHLAAAFEKPMIALYGPTSAKRTGPLSEHVQVLQQPWSCVPCLSKTCTHANVHTPSVAHCMEALSPEMVWEAVLPFLKTQ